MLEAIRKEFENSADNIISVLKFVYDTDMNIVDSHLNIISSASGRGSRYKCCDDVYKAAIKSGQDYIVKNPRKDAVCSSCGEKNRCLRKLAAVLPIKAGGDVYGALAIFCEQLNQRDNINLGLTGENPFIPNIIRLAEKSLESCRNNLQTENTSLAFEMVLNEINGCFIDLDKSMNIINYGGKLKSVFKNLSGGAVKIDKQEYGVYRLSICGKEFLVSGVLNPTPYGHIFIFNIVREVRENEYGKAIGEKPRLPAILGESKELVKLRSIAEKSSKTNSIVLISGKAGSGKENTARFIHSKKENSEGLFVKLNCAGKKRDEISLALYGDMGKSKPGKIKLAQGGVLYIENVDYMPLDILGELLLSARDSLVRYPGGITHKMDFKLILSSGNGYILSDIQAACGGGVNIIPLYVPSLRTVSGDIAEYFRHFTNVYQIEDSIDSVLADDDIITLLREYSWPGNMKELQLVSLRIAELLSIGETVDADYVRATLSASFKAFQPDAGRTLKEIEDVHIKMAVMAYGESVPAKQAAADELGIGIATLYRKTGQKNK